MYTKKLFTLLLASTVMVGSFCQNAYATSGFKLEGAKTFLYSVEQKEELFKNLENFKIPKETQNKLMDKLENGQLLDSMKQELIDKIPKESLQPTLEEPVKKYTFEDGSFIENKITVISIKKTKLSNLMNSTDKTEWTDVTRSIKGEGSVIPGGVVHGSGYAYYYDARVSTTFGIGTASFMAEFTLINGGFDQINNVRDPIIGVVGVFSNTKCEPIKKKEDAAGNAQARLSFDVTNGVGPASYTYNYKLDLYVGNNTYSSNSFFN